MSPLDLVLARAFVSSFQPSTTFGRYPQPYSSGFAQPRGFSTRDDFGYGSSGIQQMQDMRTLFAFMVLALYLSQRMAMQSQFGGQGTNNRRSCLPNGSTDNWNSRRQVPSWDSGASGGTNDGPNPITNDPGLGPRGSVTFRGAMAIDGDGSFDPRARNDPAWQPQTSLKWGNQSADANRIPYVVLSPSAARSIGAKLGDLVRVRANGRSVYAIYADNGPRVGEASMRTARALGINDSPTRGGVRSGVEYTVLPGSGGAVRNAGRPPTYEEIQAMGARAFGDPPQ